MHNLTNRNYSVQCTTYSNTPYFGISHLLALAGTVLIVGQLLLRWHPPLLRWNRACLENGVKLLCSRGGVRLVFVINALVVAIPFNLGLVLEDQMDILVDASATCPRSSAPIPTPHATLHHIAVSTALVASCYNLWSFQGVLEFTIRYRKRGHTAV